MKSYLISLISYFCILLFILFPFKTYAAIAQVAGQNKGEQGSSLANLAFTSAVTTGNQIIVTVVAYINNAVPPVINTPTRVSGATISAFSLDKSYTNNSGNDRYRIDVYRASVTSDGALTVGFTGTFDFAIASINEYSGMDASPVVDTPVTNTGTSATESTGSVVTTTCGMVLMASSELSTGNFTYTQSDTNIYKISTGASTFTGEVQHKITSSGSTYNLTAGTGNSWFWLSVGVAYKATDCGGGPAPSTSAKVKIRGGRSGSIPGVKIRGGGGRPNVPYSTTFPSTENPLSESGRWINGGTTGLDWANTRTSTNFVYGTQSGVDGYDDSTTILNGAWGPDQTAQATVVVSRASSVLGAFQEVEIRLRSTITAHVNKGYEIFCSVNTHANNDYFQIVRWNGPFGDFTMLDATAGRCVNGDVLKATIVGSTITGYINGTPILSVQDDTIKTGSPGIGFYYVNGGADPGASISDYGFSSFSAYDNSMISSVKFR